MILKDKTTGAVVAEITANHSMSVDEVLQLMNFSVTDEGQLYDVDNKNALNAWYDDLEMVW